MTGDIHQAITKSPRLFGLVCACLLLPLGCAREASEATTWPAAYPPEPAAESLRTLLTQLHSPFDPKADHSQRKLPNPHLPQWAKDRAEPFAETVRQAAYYYQIPAELLYAVIQTESGFRSDAVSPSGARGLMQLMPRTARALGVRDALDSEQNIFGGARYLRRLANRFGGDIRLVLASYNAGPGTVRKHGGIPPYPETQNYVKKVLTYYRAAQTSDS